MIGKMLRALIALTFIFGSIAIVPVAVTSPSQDVNAAARLAPVAIGSAPLTRAHLRAPREDIALLALKSQGILKKGASKEEVQAALKNYYNKFAKQTDDWIAPDVQAFDLQRETQLSATSPMNANLIQPVTASVFSLAVQFGATEVFNQPCISPDPITISGPLQGQIDFPDVGDNNTLWYSPTQTADVSFYNNLIFGYKGVGRVRFDLTDPDDGQPGINLNGLTVQDYYDNVAGKGNVIITGTVQGWVTIPHSEGYYGAPMYDVGCNNLNSDGGVGRVGKIVVDALGVFSTTHPTYYTDPSPNAFWKQYDKNGDGVVDAMWILHAGADEAAGGGAEGEFAIWSHSWSITAQGLGRYKVYAGDPNTTADDIYVDPYTIQPENADLGVLVEEFGHNFFNLPDLYTTDSNNSIGDWTEMSGGSWMGWVGGTKPVGMPLWFRMMAAYRGAGGALTPLNWQNPMTVRSYDDPSAEVEIGNLERTNSSDPRSKGVRIELPSVTKNIDNLADSGNGAWAESTDNTTRTLSRSISLNANASHTLNIDMFWDTEPDYDYAYVKVNGVTIPDSTGYFTDTNPNGGNPGWALTGTSHDGMAHTVSFNLSAYKGTSINLEVAYTCDSATTLSGVWMDNVKLDGVLLDNFESAGGDTFPGWTNAGWTVVPTARTNPRYYLVEWRSKTRYDQMVKTAYVTTDSDVNLWRVERVPYNIPGALVYYRDASYPDGYNQRGYYGDPPSFGPKNKLLVVDMNFWPMRLDPDSSTRLSGRASSYDAALTLQPSEAFTLTKVLGVTTPAGPYTFASKPAIIGFNDGKGKYAGFYYPGSGPYLYGSAYDDSVVIPARTPYSTRITHFDLTPYTELYEDPFLDPYSYWLGTGNPGDFDTQFGVNFTLTGKTGDDAYDSTATLQFGHPLHPYHADYSPDVITTTGETTIAYMLEMNNTGTLDQVRKFTVKLDPNLTLDSMALFIDGGPVPDFAKPQAKSSPIEWQFTLPADKSAFLIVVGKVDVQSQAFQFITTIQHSDGVNPTNDVTIPMITLNGTMPPPRISYFPIINK